MAYPDSETTKTRYVVRNRTGVFRIRHAAKDSGGEDGGCAARSNSVGRAPRAETSDRTWYSVE